MLCGAMAAFLVFSLAGVRDASATHMPANKGAAAGSDLDTIGQDDLLLSETMKVSSPQDLIIQVTAECSILTELTTGGSTSPGATDTATAFGAVRLRVTIDGEEVPVARNDGAGGVDDGEDDDDEIGEVTFCNRAYSRTVTDGEDPQDGIDEEHDYIATRTANAFNWLALDTGVIYDDPANGNNILQINLYADYDVTTVGDAVADAFVGSRTMIIEPIKLSIHEQVNDDGTEGT